MQRVSRLREHVRQKHTLKGQDPGRDLTLHPIPQNEIDGDRSLFQHTLFPLVVGATMPIRPRGEIFC